MSSDDRKVALITGASRGFGAEAAKDLVARGWRVFGTSRQIGIVGVDGCEMVQLDVQDGTSVQECVDEVLAKAGRVDVLVNNAGYALNGFAEEATIEQVKKVFETNYFGVVRMCQAVLPIMRKQGGGRIITVGSLAGLAGVPYRSYYASTKFALEGFCESLRSEVGAFGVDVTLIEPGFFKTELEVAAQESKTPVEDYDCIREHISNYFSSGIRRGGKAETVGRLIGKIASKSGRPKLRYRVGTDSLWMIRVKRVLPAGVYEYLARRYFKLFR